MKKNNMNGKVVIITGASSGIGKAIAIEFAHKGASVVIAARRLEALNEVAAQIKKFGGEVLVQQTDVTKEEDCVALIKATIQNYHQIDVLINNAGISMRATFSELKLSVLKNLMDVDFWGTVYCTKYALPYLLATKGTIVGVSSIAGYVGLPARTGYSASKFAMRGFLEALRTENLDKGINVLITCPGFTASNIRRTALVADGSRQSESPREEGKMMSAEHVAQSIYKAVLKRKQRLVLTVEGKLAIFLSHLLPKKVQRIIFNKMKNEADSPL